MGSPRGSSNRVGDAPVSLYLIVSVIDCKPHTPTLSRRLGETVAYGLVHSALNQAIRVRFLLCMPLSTFALVGSGLRP